MYPYCCCCCCCCCCYYNYTYNKIKLNVYFSLKIHVPDRDAKCFKEIVIEVRATRIASYN